MVRVRVSARASARRSAPSRALASERTSLPGRSGSSRNFAVMFDSCCCARVPSAPDCVQVSINPARSRGRRANVHASWRRTASRNAPASRIPRCSAKRSICLSFIGSIMNVRKRCVASRCCSSAAGTLRPYSRRRASTNTSSEGSGGTWAGVPRIGSLSRTVSASTSGRQSLGRQETKIRARSRPSASAFDRPRSARSSLPWVSFSSSTESRKNQAGASVAALHSRNRTSSSFSRASSIDLRSRSSRATKNANFPSAANRLACWRISTVFPAPASASRTTRRCSSSSGQPVAELGTYSLQAKSFSGSSSSWSANSRNRRSRSMKPVIVVSPVASRVGAPRSAVRRSQCSTPPGRNDRGRSYKAACALIVPRILPGRSE